MRVSLYIINLKRSPGRRERVIRQLRNAGIRQFRFINGLDALEYTPAQASHLLDKQHLERPLPNGMIGCTIGHVKALRQFLLDDDSDIGIILEDDFILKSNIQALTASISARLFEEGPVLLYGYIKTNVHFIKQIYLNACFNLYEVRDAHGVWSTLGYAVSKKVAARLIRAHFPVRTVSDNWHLFRENGYYEKLLIMYPFPLEHEIFSSERTVIRFRILDWLIAHRIPLFYQWLRRRRQKYVASDTHLIHFESE